MEAATDNSPARMYPNIGRAYLRNEIEQGTQPFYRRDPNFDFKMLRDPTSEFGVLIIAY